MRRGVRLLRVILAFAFLVSWTCSATADVGAVCEAIAGSASAKAGETEEAELGDLVEKVIGYLPEGTQYLEARPADSEDLLDLFGCDDPLICRGDQVPDWMFHLGPDDDWSLGMVDTRPWSDLVFVLAGNYLRCGRVVALQQHAEHEWSRIPLGPRDLAQGCTRRPTVLRSGTSPYLVLPGFTSTFGKSGGPEDGRESKRLSLSLFAATPAIEAEAEACTVSYTFTPHLVTSTVLLAPPEGEEAAIRGFLDRHATAMTAGTAFYDDEWGAQIAALDEFVLPGTAPEELATLRNFFSAAEPETLTEEAIGLLIKAGANELETTRGRSRWIAAGFNGRAYAVLLAEYEEFAMPVDEWHSIIALFSGNAQGLQPVTVYELRSLARFERAAAAAGQTP
jgi:hypothetical protein